MSLRRNIHHQKTKAREALTFSSSLNKMTLLGGHHVCIKSYNFHS